MKIKIIRESGLPITYLTATIRIFAHIIFGLVPLVAMLNYLSIIFSEKKQAWHDKIAKTLVIETKD